MPRDDGKIFCPRCDTDIGDAIDISEAPPEVLVKSVEFLWRTLLNLQERVESLYSLIPDA